MTLDVIVARHHRVDNVRDENVTSTDDNDDKSVDMIWKTISQAKNQIEKSIYETPQTSKQVSINDHREQQSTPRKSYVTGDKVVEFFDCFRRDQADIQNMSKSFEDIRVESPLRRIDGQEDLLSIEISDTVGQIHLAISDEMEPNTYQQAVSGPNKTCWLSAISEELAAHNRNQTWSIVSRPTESVSLSAKWVFKLKRDKEGKIERYKARLVARGFKQRQGFDHFETYAAVVNIDTISTILSLIAGYNLKYIQFNVSTAFLNGTKEKEIFLDIPEGLKVDNNKCLKLRKVLYRLEPSPRAWKTTFDNSC